MRACLVGRSGTTRPVARGDVQDGRGRKLRLIEIEHIFGPARGGEQALLVGVRDGLAALLRAEVEDVPDRTASKERARVCLRKLRLVIHALPFGGRVVTARRERVQARV